MKEMVKQLREKDNPVILLAKCHVAALNAGQGLEDGIAMTTQAFVHRMNAMGGFTRGVLVLEEVFTMDAVLL